MSSKFAHRGSLKLGKWLLERLRERQTEQPPRPSETDEDPPPSSRDHS